MARPLLPLSLAQGESLPVGGDRYPACDLRTTWVEGVQALLSAHVSSPLGRSSGMRTEGAVAGVGAVGSCYRVLEGRFDLYESREPLLAAEYNSSTPKYPIFNGANAASVDDDWAELESVAASSEKCRGQASSVLEL